MTASGEEREEHVYFFANCDAWPRTVVIEHPVRQGWSFAEGTEAAESSTSFRRFI